MNTIDYANKFTTTPPPIALQALLPSVFSNDALKHRRALLDAVLVAQQALQQLDDTVPTNMDEEVRRIVKRSQKNASQNRLRPLDRRTKQILNERSLAGMSQALGHMMEQRRAQSIQGGMGKAMLDLSMAKQRKMVIESMFDRGTVTDCTVEDGKALLESANAEIDRIETWIKQINTPMKIIEAPEIPEELKGRVPVIKARMERKRQQMDADDGIIEVEMEIIS